MYEHSGQYYDQAYGDGNACGYNNNGCTSSFQNPPNFNSGSNNSSTNNNNVVMAPTQVDISLNLNTSDWTFGAMTGAVSFIGDGGRSYDTSSNNIDPTGAPSYSASEDKTYQTYLNNVSDAWSKPYNRVASGGGSAGETMHEYHGEALNCD